jgi:hypothetical protein
MIGGGSLPSHASQAGHLLMLVPSARPSHRRTVVLCLLTAEAADGASSCGQMAGSARGVVGTAGWLVRASVQVKCKNPLGL